MKMQTALTANANNFFPIKDKSICQTVISSLKAFSDDFKMFTKFAFVLLTISLSGVALTAATNEVDFKQNVVKSLKNLRGINCMVDAVFDLEDAADEFSYQVYACGAAASYTSQLSNVQSLMAYTTSVIQLNDGVCNNSAFDDDLDGATIPTPPCSANLDIQMSLLFKQFDATNTDIVNGLAATTTVTCVKTAMNYFKDVLNNFESGIAFCGSNA